jgi:hypothetical protein
MSQEQTVSWLQQELQRELGDLYANSLWFDIQKILELYNVYDGPGQDWKINKDLDYTPTKKITNLIKHLIKEEARFMFSRSPEITIQPVGDDDANKELCAKLEDWLRQLLEANSWQTRLTNAGRDCFIGKRIALKLSGKAGEQLKIRFIPSMGFFHSPDDDDVDQLDKIIFYHHSVESSDTSKQRTWVQKYWLEKGKCKYNESVYDGDGVRIEGDSTAVDTKLDTLPVYVIINDGLTGDVLGESDVEEIRQDQDSYNRLKSDDHDALKFNMFPMMTLTDASQESADAVKKSPGALLDLQTDPSAGISGRQAQAAILEAKFGYDQRFEHTIGQTRHDMWSLLSTPEFNIEHLKSLGISGKAMKALYWALICRCEEKWACWDSALKWMVRMLVKMAKAYVGQDFTAAKFIIVIEHLWPIPDDEEDERRLDLQEVTAKVRSHLSYIEKWQPTADAKEELQQIKDEQVMLEGGFDL